jgi:hypothetical protein
MTFTKRQKDKIVHMIGKGDKMGNNCSRNWGVIAPGRIFNNFAGETGWDELARFKENDFH